MTYFFNRLPFPYESRMTGIWHNVALPASVPDEIVTGHLVLLPDDQHAAVESSFLIGHLPFWVGGFEGVLPDGRPWLFVLQKAPVDAARLAGVDEPAWTLRHGLDRALRFNTDAEIVDEIVLMRPDLLNLYARGGVHPRRLRSWPVEDLVRGLLAECCYVSLPELERGYGDGCAFPDAPHDCCGDVFSDVFTAWQLRHIDELRRVRPTEDATEAEAVARPTKAELRMLERDELVTLANAYRVRRVEQSTTKGLIKAIRQAHRDERDAGIRRLRGDEPRVVFQPGDAFAGVTGDWLATVLELDPDSSPVDFAADEFTVLLDHYPFYFELEEILRDAPEGDQLVEVGDGDGLFAYATLHGAWLRDTDFAGSDRLVWVGPDDAPRELALDWLADFVETHDLDDHPALHVSSPHLSADTASDVSDVLAVVSAATSVLLDGERLAPTDPDG